MKKNNKNTEFFLHWYHKWNKKTTQWAKWANRCVYYGFIPMLFTLGIVTSKASAWITFCQFVPVESLMEIARLFIPDFETITADDEDP